MQPFPRLSALLLAAALALATGARAGVLVVNAGSGPFTSLQSAVNAAANGDTILVRTPLPLEDSWFINNKSLVVAGDAPSGAAVPVGAARLRNLVAAGRIVVRGLQLWPAFPAQAGITVEDCAGAVWIEDCVAHGGLGQGTSLLGVCSAAAGGAGLLVQDSSRVVVLRSLLIAGEGSGAGFLPPQMIVPPSSGGAGARLEGSVVAMQGCTALGGDGGAGVSQCVNGTFTAVGGAGLAVTGSKVLVAGSIAIGGAPQAAGAGAGLWVEDTASSLEILDTSFTPGGAGPAIVNAGSPLLSYDDIARSLAIDSPLHEGESGTLAIEAAAGEPLALFWSFQGGVLPMPGKHGWFLLDAATVQGPFLLGTLPGPGGTWDLPFTAPVLLGGLDTQTFLLQAVFQSAAGLRLGAPTTLTLVLAGV